MENFKFLENLKMELYQNLHDTAHIRVMFTAVCACTSKRTQPRFVAQGTRKTNPKVK